MCVCGGLLCLFCQKRKIEWPFLSAPLKVPARERERIFKKRFHILRRFATTPYQKGRGSYLDGTSWDSVKCFVNSFFREALVLVF